jgi:hypothetical protein
MTLKNMQRETRVLASVTWEFNTKLCLIVMYLNLMAAWGWLHGAGCMGLAAWGWQGRSGVTKMSSKEKRG